MTEEEKHIDNAAPASEEQVVDSGEKQPEPQEKMVPLAALEAERRKRQELEQQNRAYQEFLAKQKAQQEQEDEAWVSRGEVKKEKELTKQEILEQVFIDSNPEKMQEINTHLEKLVERKPWMRDAIASAPNRYARAYELVQDYKHTLIQQKQNISDAQRIVDNSKKPGSPVPVAKGSPANNKDYLMSIRGTPEFRKYREDIKQGKR